MTAAFNSIVGHLPTIVIPDSSVVSGTYMYVTRSLLLSMTLYNDNASDKGDPN